ncbi:Formyltetrahydrofolate deformylase [gamma proteobacterium HdN1]|nr:Formyltetrahydrofolate deformylase [gamma proteobacterium HdN1]
MEQTYRLVISCPDQVGIVARVSQIVAEYGGWLTEASYHSDSHEGWFFMRNEIRAESLRLSLRQFRDVFRPLAEEYRMKWHVSDSMEKHQVGILASHASHCLADILHRWHSGDLYCNIPCVISNHDNLRKMVEWYDIPFYHLPIDRENKEEAHQEMMRLLQQHRADTVVLARYMQILPSWFCKAMPNQVINIHHSFLPSFIGANPYQQAYERGVKLIGATCHYVTENLDQGPIIEQDVARVNHRHSRDDMVRLGKDIEMNVLSRGLRAHVEDRVIVHGNKTVILE